MKTTKICNNDGTYAAHSHILGTIEVNPESGIPQESQVVMSAKNFAILINMIPKSSGGRTLRDEIRKTINNLNELSYADSSRRESYNKVLSQALGYSAFIEDVEMFSAVMSPDPVIKVVGKIPQNDLV